MTKTVKQLLVLLTNVTNTHTQTDCIFNYHVQAGVFLKIDFDWELKASIFTQQYIVIGSRFLWPYIMLAAVHDILSFQASMCTSKGGFAHPIQLWRHFGLLWRHFGLLLFTFCSTSADTVPLIFTTGAVYISQSIHKSARDSKQKISQAKRFTFQHFLLQTCWKKTKCDWQEWVMKPCNISITSPSKLMASQGVDWKLQVNA